MMHAEGGFVSPLVMHAEGGFVSPGELEGPALAAGPTPDATPYASPHLTLPCVNSAPARAASCIRIRSAARSNSCLHLSEQKKYRRFLYSLEGERSLPS